MASKTLGFVYTGLAMEMLNIMQSRLERMATSKDITSQLMGNFIPILLSVEFSNNIFKNQQRSVIEETPLRFRFEDCIAASEDFAMTSTSFNTLYQLMVMGFKRQVVMSSSMGELVVAMRRNMAKLDKLTAKPSALASLGFLMKQFVAAFQNMSSAHSVVLQFSVMQFLQNHRIQVSIFVQEGDQLLDGSFVISLAGPVPANADTPGTSKLYDEDSGHLISTNPNYFKSPIYVACTPYQLAARLSFNVNAYQQQYPPWPEMAKSKQSVSTMQCQTDPLILASLSDHLESRLKLQDALEQLGDDTEYKAEIIAAEQRDIALKMLAEQEAAKLDKSKPGQMQNSRPLHLPHSSFDRIIKSQVSEEQQEAMQKVREHVLQRDSVVRLRDMLNRCQNLSEVPRADKQSDHKIAHTSARKLPKRMFGSLREPPQILTQTSESLISLAEKLRHLDVTTAGWESAENLPHFAEDSVKTLLHQKLEQIILPVHADNGHADGMGTTYSLSQSLQSRQRNTGDL